MYSDLQSPNTMSTSIGRGTTPMIIQKKTKVFRIIKVFQIIGQFICIITPCRKKGGIKLLKIFMNKDEALFGPTVPIANNMGQNEVPKALTIPVVACKKGTPAAVRIEATPCIMILLNTLRLVRL